jgi:hypothetical protein
MHAPLGSNARDPAPYAFVYEATDIPAGMTIREYRLARGASEDTAPDREGSIARASGRSAFAGARLAAGRLARRSRGQRSLGAPAEALFERARQDSNL